MLPFLKIENIVQNSRCVKEPCSAVVAIEWPEMTAD